MKLSKNDVAKLFKMAKRGVVKHSPEILTGLGIAGMVTTTVLAVKATPKALKLIDEEKRETGKKELTPVETVKVAWKPYVPSAITCTVSIACLIGANSVNARRNAALYSAYKLSETALTEYREKVVETIGEKKEQAIRDKIVEEKVQNLVIHEDNIVHTGHGSTLFFEPISKTLFRSSERYIDKVKNDLNWKMSYANEPYISFGEFLSELKLPKWELDQEIGWRTDKGLIDLSYPAGKTDDGEPCLVLEYLVRPEWDYDDLYG